MVPLIVLTVVTLVVALFRRPCRHRNCWSR